jgi:hypothetical protein
MVSQKKGNPNQSFNLAADIEEGFDELGRLPSRLERYAHARSRSIVNVAQIDKKLNFLEDEESNGVGLSTFIAPSLSSSSDLFHNILSGKFIGPIHPDTYNQFQKDSLISKERKLEPNTNKLSFQEHLKKLRPKIFECGDYLGFKNYHTVGKVRLTSANFCKAHLMCPLCAIRRGVTKLDAYVKRYHTIMQEYQGLRLSMVTFTVKNGDDLQERYEHLKKSVQRLLKHRRKSKEGKSNTDFSKALGLVGTYEVTNKDKGWHPHVHMMVLHRENFNYKKLRAEWLKITGDSHVFNVTPCQNPDKPEKDFLEVFKYAVKFSDLTPEQNMEAYEILRGKRLLISAGLFWGVKVPESQLDKELDELPFIELFYKYIHGSGYNLTTKKELFFK